MIPAYDKYAPYIWSAYGLTALILVGLALWLWLEARRAARLLAELEAARPQSAPLGASPARPSATAAALKETSRPSSAAPIGEAP